MALIDDIINEMAAHPRMKEALEEVNKTRNSFSAGNVSARLVCECELDGETVPVIFAVTVGAEESDEIEAGADDVFAGDDD